MKKKIITLAVCSILAQQAIANEHEINNQNNKYELAKTGSLVKEQWPLDNTGQSTGAEQGGTAGIDLNLKETHAKGIKGQGVTIAVVDSGLEVNHPELMKNIAQGSVNVHVAPDDEQRNNPIPYDEEEHGTAVAGIIAAKGRIIGVAPEAKIIGMNLLASPDLQPNSDQHEYYGPDKVDRETSMPYQWLSAHGGNKGAEGIRIFNLSYGNDLYESQAFIPESDYQLDLMERKLKRQSLQSNGGRGALYIKAAGNEYSSAGYMEAFRTPGEDLPFHNANSEYENSNYWYMLVSAINADGVLASYSSVGSNVFLTAPGGEDGEDAPAILTTDLMGCHRGSNQSLEDGDAPENSLHHGATELPNCELTATMNGTSSATPHAAGAVALLMSNYPNLHQRDIRHLLATTARKVDQDYGDIPITYKTRYGTTRTVTGLEGWSKNAAGYWYSPYYGFGLIDVDRAMERAATWQPLPPLKITEWESIEPFASVPDAGTAPTVTSTQIINKNLIVEAVQVRVDIAHSRASDLLIELVSPAGTRSILMSPDNMILDDQYGFNKHLLLTHKFFGEQADGVWSLEVTDTSAEQKEIYIWDHHERDFKAHSYQNDKRAGLIKEWSIRFFGYQ